MAEQRLQQQVEFLLEADKLKHILRQSVLTNGSRRENDAEHSWHLALCAMVLQEYAPADVDIARVLQIALLHDMVEIYAGDTFAYDAQANQGKYERELAAARNLYALLPADIGARFLALWQEFEQGITPESRYAAAMDRLMPLLHNHYTTGTPTWVSHAVTRTQVYARMQPIRTATPALWPLVERIVESNVQNGRILPD